jgi:alkanesulfonate monooxygenase SsuD/methylene tetrahydromethanopterin reductase-like flavin-dependent oxidoreductase (luciferase family)
MDIALHVSDFTPFGPPATLAAGLSATARAADEAGFATLTLMDHYFQMEQMAPATDPMLEGYTALGFLAGQTERLQLGLLVTGVTYRQPGLLAKTLATLDVLSGGRALLGIGAAWYEREHLGLGVSSAWRRRCASAVRCGDPTTAHSPESITNSPRRCACLRRCSRAARRS